MKYCSNCGQALPDSAEFCNACGSKYQAVQQPQPGVVNNTQSSYQSFTNHYNNYTQTEKVGYGSNGLTKVASAILVFFGVLTLFQLIGALSFGWAPEFEGLETILYITVTVQVFLYFWYVFKINDTCKKCGRFSTGFKVCVLLFGGIIPGILLLCDSQH